MYTDETKQLFNPLKHKNRRSRLRSTQTLPEAIFWQKVRGRQLGVKFRRQHGISEYIVDFYCAERRLIIEIDGDSHFTPDKQEYDARRDNFLKQNKFTVLRFTNRQIMEEINEVIEAVNQFVCS